MNTTNQAQLARCPHCESVFTASEEEMQLALGAVRCGECMKIFNASYHLIVSQTTIIDNQAITQTTQIVSSLTISEEQPENIPTLHEHPEHHQEQESIPNPSHSLNDDLYLEDDLELNVDPESDDLQNHYLSNEIPLATDLANQEKPSQTKSKVSKKINLPIAAGLGLLVMFLLVGGWFITNKTPATHYEFSEIRLSPSSNPQKMDVHFNLINISGQILPLPNLTVELLNLSSQAISSELINATNLPINLAKIEAGSSHAMTVTVKRPSTFVQSARIQIDSN